MPPERKVYVVVAFVAFLNTLFVLAYFMGTYLTGTTYTASPEYCALGNSPRPYHFSIMVPLYLLFINVALSLSFDFAMVRAIRRRVGANELIQDNMGEYLKIPVRATTFSALCFMPLALFGIALKIQENDVGIEIGAYLAQTTAIITTVVRAPLTLLITFKSIRTSRAREQSRALRDKRLKKEMRHAYKARKSDQQETSIQTIS